MTQNTQTKINQKKGESIESMKIKVDNAIKSFIEGECLSNEQLDLFCEFSNVADDDTNDFLDVIELANEIRSNHSEQSIRNLVVYGFQDAYNLAKKNCASNASNENVFNYFINVGGYPNHTLIALNAKYLFNESEYIAIHRKAFEMFATGASVEEIARIL